MNCDICPLLVACNQQKAIVHAGKTAVTRKAAVLSRAQGYEDNIHMAVELSVVDGQLTSQEASTLKLRLEKLRSEEESTETEIIQRGFESLYVDHEILVAAEPAIKRASALHGMLEDMCLGQTLPYRYRVVEKFKQYQAWKARLHLAGASKPGSVERDEARLETWHQTRIIRHGKCGSLLGRNALKNLRTDPAIQALAKLE